MDDLEYFLEALDNMPEDVHKAKFAGASDKKPRSRKRDKKLFDHTIDLHGMTSEQAITVLDSALKRYQNGTSILVITGCGNNSEGGVAVIRNCVRKYLEKNSGYLLREFRQAPGKYGGDGAYIIVCR